MRGKWLAIYLIVFMVLLQMEKYLLLMLWSLPMVFLVLLPGRLKLALRDGYFLLKLHICKKWNGCRMRDWKKVVVDLWRILRQMRNVWIARGICERRVSKRRRCKRNWLFLLLATLILAGVLTQNQGYMWVAFGIVCMLLWLQCNVRRLFWVFRRE